MITWNNVTGISPRLSTANINTQTEILHIVNDVLINDQVWCDVTNADKGRIYLAAHLGTLALLNGTGTVTAEQVGQLSRSYGTVQGLKGSLALTSYGAEYERLTRLLPTTLGAVY